MFPFKVLEEKYNSIPDNVREAISSTEVNRKLKNIVDNYRLQLDEAEELTKEIGYVMLGLKSSDDFVKNIQKVTGLTKELSEKVAEDVNNIILKEIKISLRASTQKQDINEEDDDNFNEEEQQKVRDELMQEIESSKEKTTDLIKKPKQELQKVNPVTNKEPEIPTIPNEIYPVRDKELKTPVASNEANQKNTPTPNKTDSESIEPKKEDVPTLMQKEIPTKSTEKIKQNSEKEYIIDPYREPIE